MYSTLQHIYKTAGPNNGSKDEFIEAVHILHRERLKLSNQ